MSEDSLGTKFGNAIRDIATDQAAAYTKYAALLDGFAKKEVDFLSFGRGALDIYADALRDWTQVGGRIANDSVKVGVSKVRSLRLVKSATDAVGSISDAVVASADEATDPSAKSVRTRRKTA